MPQAPEAADIAMMPAENEFATDYNSGRAQVVWTRLVADLETPVSAYMKLVRDRGTSFLLESVEGGETRGRYSIIGLAPDILWRANGDSASINRTPHQTPDAFEPTGTGTLASLRELLAESAIDLPEDLPPMAAGVFGYMGYETVRLVENLPDDREPALDVPDALMMRPTLIVVFDTVKDELTLVTPVRPSKGVTSDQAFAAARERLKAAITALEDPLGLSSAPGSTDIA